MSLDDRWFLCDLLNRWEVDYEILADSRTIVVRSDGKKVLGRTGTAIDFDFSIDGEFRHVGIYGP